MCLVDVKDFEGQWADTPWWLALIGSVTFEDKRKENFDRGNAELEKRRQALQEQQRREEERRAQEAREEQERREQEALELERRRLLEQERRLERMRELERQKEEERQKELERKEVSERPVWRSQTEVSFLHPGLLLVAGGLLHPEKIQFHLHWKTVWAADQ